MLRRYLLIGVLLGQVIAILLLIAFFVQRPSGASAAVLAAPELAPHTAPEAAPDAQGAITSAYFWNYSAKFVCGYQPPIAVTDPGESIVKPGNYATEINIHNYSYKQIPIKLKHIQLVNMGAPANPIIVRQPNDVGPITVTKLLIGPDYATMDDCNGLWLTMNPAKALPSPMPLFVGYLVIISPLDLDVDVVYTANAPGTAGTTPVSTAIDVERVTGKRVFIPAGTLP